MKLESVSMYPTYTNIQHAAQIVHWYYIEPCEEHAAQIVHWCYIEPCEEHVLHSEQWMIRQCNNDGRDDNPYTMLFLYLFCHC